MVEPVAVRPIESVTVTEIEIVDELGIAGCPGTGPRVAVHRDASAPWPNASDVLMPLAAVAVPVTAETATDA